MHSSLQSLAEEEYSYMIKIMGEFLKENKVKTLRWPSFSPDQNTVEDIWDFSKKLQQQHNFSSITSDKNVLKPCKTLISVMENLQR